MANPEHVKILHEGVWAWNAWRKQNTEILPDLCEVKLTGVNLSEANLREAKLIGADLSGAMLFGTDLSGADLSGADLSGVELYGADLSGANLSGAKLWGAELSRAKLSGTNLSRAAFLYAILADVNLSEALGLDTVQHCGPSSVGIDTFVHSGGKIPESFLRGAGVPDAFLQYATSVAGRIIEFFSAFISYSTKDEDLAKRLYADLQAKGVRCWFASEDLKIGDKFHTEIDRAIRVHDKLLLLLSANSISSDWVEKEVESAFERERRDKRTVLFPVRLDDTIMDAVDGWAADIRRLRHIGDFTKWKDHGAYQKAFDRLLRDLKSD